MKRGFGGGSAVCLFLILLGSVGPQAQDRPKRVLLLFDEDRSLPGLAMLERSLRAGFSAKLGTDIEFFAESMNLSRFNTAADELARREYYSKKYRERRPDLIVAVMGTALRFLLQHGDEVFPNVPIVFCGADAKDLEDVSLPNRVTGVLLQRSFAPTVDVVLQLQPGTRRIVVVGGTSEFDRHLLNQAREQFKPFEQRVPFEFLTDRSMPDLLATVSRLPADTVVTFVTLFRDGAGRTFVPHDAVAELAAAASVPLYVFVDQYLGRGAVGGHVYSLQQHGASAADVGLQVLNGTLPSAIPVREVSSSASMFDARQLLRWRLDERRLPENSIVTNREPSLFDRYRSYFIAGVLLLGIQTVMIAGLLFQSRKRRRAEAALRASYERISNLGTRLLTAQDAERAHLARELHDDIGQQVALLQIRLGAIIRRTDAGQLMDALRETSTSTTALGKTVHDLSHRLHPAQLRLVGLTAALASLQHQLSCEKVSVVFCHDKVPPSIPDDVALCMYRVAQEALSNALKHGRADRVSVALRGEPSGLHMAIEDNGTGFDLLTASSGLGLVTMTERVEHVGGSIQVQSQVGRGTRLDVTIPCAVTGPPPADRA